VKPAQIPANEAERLAALRRYDILDTPAEMAFDDFTKLASQICDVPIALISLVDAGRQWFKSKVGLDAQETPRDISFCGHAIHGDQLFEVSNALEDARFRDNPLVTGAPDIRFYAGTPLVTPDGFAIGTLCVIDRVSRQLTPTQQGALAGLGRQVVHLLELRLRASEVRELNQDLAQKECFQRALLDSAANAIISTSVEGVITSFNRAAELLLGYTAEELVGKLTAGVFHDGAQVAARAQELSRELGRNIEPGFEVFVAKVGQGEHETREWTYLRKDGARVPVQLSVSGIRDEQGRLTGFLGLAHDISERKQSEMDWVTAKERLDLALGASGLATWDADMNTGKVFLDERWAAMMGEESARKVSSFSDLVALAPAQDRDRLLAAIVDVLKGRTSEYRFEHQVHTKALGWRWIQSRGKVVARDPSGRALRMIGVNADITEHKQAEQRLRDSAARIEAILDTVVDGVITIDERGSVETLNPAAQRIFGYATAEVVGQNVKMLMPEPYHSEHDGYLEHYVATGEARVIGSGREAVGRRKDGSNFPMELAVGEMRLGGKRHYTGIVRDITARKQAEEALVTAKTAAEHANQAKSEFLSNMSHEIRTPLNAILGFGQMLERRPLPEESMRLVSHIRNEGTSLLGLINNVLDLTRIDSGAVEIENMPFQLQEVLERVKSRLQGTLGAKPVALRGWAASAGVSDLIGDPLRLEQVLTNLGGNALKFTDHGHVELRVTLLALADAHATLHFAMIDTGIGIAHDKLQEIFQPFQQADISTTRLYGGTGLGLAISQRLVSAMGGELVASSTPGQGSCFEFSLRLAVDDRADAVQQTPALARSASAEVPGQRLRGVRVLVVDDMEINREVARLLLEDEGATVRQAENGAQALDWLNAHSGEVDVVLMDVQMPVMDGYEATRRMRATPVLATLTVIGLSAGAFSDQRQAALAAGMSDFITKPFEIDDLVRCIRSQLAAKPAPEVRATAVPGAAPEAALQPAVSEPASDYPGLDEARALKVWRTPAQLARYLEIFAKTLEAALAQLRSTEAKVVSACAHKLKGAAGNLGLDELAAQAKALEDVLGQGADSAASLAALEAAISTAMQTIHRYTFTHAARPESTP